MAEEKGSEGSARACARAFLEGAARPSLASALGSLGVAGLWLALCALLLTPERLAGATGRGLVAKQHDDYALLTHETLALARTPPGPEAVTLVGSSTLREALASPEALASRVSELVGRAVPVRLLTGSELTPLEELAVLDAARPGLRGLVVLDINVGKSYHGPSSAGEAALRPRLALGSPAADAAVRAAGAPVPRRTGNYFLDNFRFFLARPAALKNLLRPIPEVSQHRYEGRVARDDAKWRKAVAKMHRWLPVYRAHRDWTFATYARAIALARSSGLRVALLEGARNPRVDTPSLAPPGARALYDEYRADARRFAREQGVPYWDLNAAAGLTQDDFFDQEHVLDPAARRRFTEELARRISALFREVAP